MKKLAVLLVIMATFAVAAKADDRPISATQLPQAAQTFIKKYFPKSKVSLATIDKELFGSTYDAVLSDGTKIEFDSKGNWKEVKSQNLPQSLVPAAIIQKAKEIAPGTTVMKIEKRDRGGYEVKLSNGMELEFNKQLQLTDIDN